MKSIKILAIAEDEKDLSSETSDNNSIGSIKQTTEPKLKNTFTIANNKSTIRNIPKIIKTDSIGSDPKNQIMVVVPLPNDHDREEDNDDADDNDNDENEINENAVIEIKTETESETDIEKESEDSIDLSIFELLDKNSKKFILRPATMGLTLKCQIFRQKGIYSQYKFYLENLEGQLLLIMTARKRKRSKTPCYVINYISYDETDVEKYIETPIAKLKSNLIGKNLNR